MRESVDVEYRGSFGTVFGDDVLSYVIPNFLELVLRENAKGGNEPERHWDGIGLSRHE